LRHQPDAERTRFLLVDVDGELRLVLLAVGTGIGDELALAGIRQQPVEIAIPPEPAISSATRAATNASRR